MPPFLTEFQRSLLQAIQGGFPIVARPYQAIGQTIGCGEAEVIAGLAELQQLGIIKRMGIIVRHHELGFRANAMVVWDVPDARVTELGQRIRAFPFVRLCYHRQRVRPQWPFNLYCMIHGRRRAEVLEQVDRLIADCALHPFPHKVLFSQKRFKQRGAFYMPQTQTAALAAP